ncbi:hypothetical protein Phi13:1_gp086 [Cellulophaga phage phi13:1]|uniref:Uncharacterized protein n=1 Tax=Cellulophaga phage phi13:1 TaxID=1327992 RepID=S0A3V9_9CAUD|nr:hypothetical protein Phi13:1_gp086 [Cellulophaga phage phi13:1]
MIWIKLFVIRFFIFTYSFFIEDINLDSEEELDYKLDRDLKYYRTKDDHI